MPEKTIISLKDQAIIITGAGRGLGRAYALSLAKRGANIIVNDLGVDDQGQGSNAAIAQAVVDEIKSQGGTAIADTSDISIPNEAANTINLAIKHFGKIDVLINNAGICGNQLFCDAQLADFEHYWKVHVAGPINITKAAWPYMCSQQYGRVILTESGAGLYGMAGQATYSAAKGAVHGLMKTLAIEGREHGILVNAVSPGGFSRMHEAAIDDQAMLEQTRQIMPPEMVTPAVIWLASNACKISGETFSVWSGRVARIGIGTGKGYFDRNLTAESVAAHYSEISNITPLYEPTSSLDEVSAWLEGRIDGCAPDLKS